ncbi:UDP-sugar transporter protein SLC35A4 [Biomphalaria pfeifferi]|uniref:UDP-sugar transporter protein SLC35A4 n=1 Tax=Biomphalaria pfeifferi TaxID=112525 RepID=A0AAD8CCA4_BIOPF|nr:UDP-sugar transporter protein SLC35A4 [Biomphalaria pfeifferi]
MAKFMKSAFQNPLSFYGILLIEVLAYSSYGVFINLSRVNGIIMYKSSSLVLLLEIIKFTISFMILWSEKNKLNYKQIKFRSVISFSLPALCYGINNNLAVYMQDYMDPSTFQVLCNLKIVSTAVLYRLIMNRKLKFVQWLSLTLMTLAGMLNSYIGMKDKPQSLNDVYLTPVGLSLTLVYCFLSGLAGVYTEYILKKEPMTLLSLQNCYLYIFGILFNFTFWYSQTAEDESLLQGFTLYTWLILLTQTEKI